MISFIEKEAKLVEDARHKDMYAANFMVKDGVEYFIMNHLVQCEEPSQEHRRRRNESELNAAKALLSKNDGKYCKFSGDYEDPFEMIKEVAKCGCAFTSDDLFVDCRNRASYGEGFVDFHGNTTGMIGSFFYRIYDEEILSELKKAVEPLPKGWETT